ncbi:Hypothetical predicted protein [Olea europaea subsp. europaea]|uniref:Uncharacterized protein n=1 Tax=Olea europaea subsp. europaea TaxID=158383 RepID=A0A8S0SNF9_OLEEU|nr:Hypothetical predicted protein [Olea europaea subsp. europaea]
MSEMRPDHGKDAASFSGIFGHDVWAMFRTRPATSGMQPDFQAFLGSFWMCPSHGIFGHVVQVMSGMHPGHDRDTTSFLGIVGHGVQVMSGTCPGHGQDAA